ncbi:MAG TPA: hypothetical protein VFA26_05835 [Gemmataceae bacterium]|nr:hypothetical protein [Gemmataceae bacterium]
MKKWTKPVGGAALLGVAALVLLACAESKAQPPGRGERTTAEGVVKRFTTAPRGEIDGAVLDDGTVLHWPPHLERRFTAILAKGDRVRATGWIETGPEGDTHLEVRTLTNLRTEASRENDSPAPPPPPGRRALAPDGPAGLDRRLQKLEDQIDELRREIARLRREK